MRGATPKRRIVPLLISPSQAARAAEAFAAATTAAAPLKEPVTQLGELSLREQAAYSDAHQGPGRRIFVELAPGEVNDVNWRKVRCTLMPLFPLICLPRCSHCAPCVAVAAWSPWKRRLQHQLVEVSSNKSSGALEQLLKERGVSEQPQLAAATLCPANGPRGLFPVRCLQSHKPELRLAPSAAPRALSLVSVR